jgi:hypothetical protein
LTATAAARAERSAPAATTGPYRLACLAIIRRCPGGSFLHSS